MRCIRYVLVLSTLSSPDILTSTSQRLNGIQATPREALPDDTPEKIEEEREAAQKFIDEAEPLTEEEQALKEELVNSGFPDWSRRDFQQLVKALEAYGWDEDMEVYANEIGDKTPEDVEEYYNVFKERWVELPGTSLFLFVGLCEGC